MDACADAEPGIAVNAAAAPAVAGQGVAAPAAGVSSAALPGRSSQNTSLGSDRDATLSLSSSRGSIENAETRSVADASTGKRRRLVSKTCMGCSCSAQKPASPGSLGLSRRTESISGGSGLDSAGASAGPPGSAAHDSDSVLRVDSQSALAAAAAEARTRKAKATGVGDIANVERWQARAATQDAAGTTDVFGAAAADRLREQILRGREQAAKGRSHLDEALQDMMPSKRTVAAIENERIGSNTTPSEEPSFCTARNHICSVDTTLGCSSCFRMCHQSCEHALCLYEPCEYCLSMSVVTHPDSDLCLQIQQNAGCHSCASLDCWSSSPCCVSRIAATGSTSSAPPSNAARHTQFLCTRLLHRCPPARLGEGCSSCGKMCHDTHDDPRCGFTRARGVLNWHASSQQLQDVRAGTGGSVPHFSQTEWRFDGRTSQGKTRLIVNGLQYYRGYGNPGRSRQGACSNNCLIDSLRQCLGMHSDPELVRQDLLRDFCNAEGLARVTQRSFLDLE